MSSDAVCVIAVVGVGYLGRHHARILSTLPGVELVAVVDTNRRAAAEIAAATEPGALDRLSRPPRRRSTR